MKNIIYFILGGLIAVLTTLLLVEKGYYAPNYIEYQNPTKTDTIRTNSVYKEVIIQPKEVAIPYEVKIYQTDTIYRESLEQDTLISSVIINQKSAQIHTITPSGIPLVNTYPVQNFSEIQINHKGQAKIELQKHPKRKKILRWLERVLIFGGTAALTKNI